MFYFWNFRHRLVRYYWYHIGMTDIWFKKTGCTNGPTELQLFSTKQSLRSSGCRTLGRGFHRALVGAHGFIGASTRLACGSRCDGSPHKWAPGVYHFGPYPHQVTSVSWITILNLNAFKCKILQGTFEVCFGCHIFYSCGQVWFQRIFLQFG